MNLKQWTLIGWCCCLAILVFRGSAEAFYLDEDETCFFSGEFQTRASLRMEDSEGFTSPNVATGNLVQHRNLLYAELRHDLSKVNWPANFKVKYHVRARFLYEGVYDYGPHAFQDLPNHNFVEDIDDFKWDANIWEAYADISRGPLFFRLGKQNLSWGETDVFRILDNINPLDNTFGGIFEDLDDRRIPLNMARGSYNFGKVGPVTSFTLEGFWVPGSWENDVSPVTPPGTPYALPIPPIGGSSIPGVLSLFERINHPDRDSSSSRWGVRWQGVLGDNLTISLAHYKSFLDDPAGRFVVDQQFVPLPPPALPIPGVVALEFSFSRVRITGASMNYYDFHTDMVIRSEFAYLEDVPVNIPEINTPGPTIIPIPVPPFGLPQFNTGEIPEKDQLRFSLSLDKDIWIRALNDKTRFSCTLQYTGQYTKDYDDRMRAPFADFPDPTDLNVRVKRYEQSYTLLIMNQGGWMNGNLFPEIVGVYDPRGAYMIQPAVLYRFDPFQMKLTYSNIGGNFVNIGFFKDRDQLTLNFSWLF